MKRARRPASPIDASSGVSNASNVVKPRPPLGPAPSTDELLDAAVEYTFPASDPISVDHAFREAKRREDRGRRR
jgi:hypothetical protein